MTGLTKDQAELMAEDFLKRYEESLLDFTRSMAVTKGRITVDTAIAERYKEKRKVVVDLLISSITEDPRIPELTEKLNTQIARCESDIQANLYNGAQRSYPVDGELQAYKQVKEWLK